MEHEEIVIDWCPLTLIVRPILAKLTVHEGVEFGVAHMLQK